MISCLLNNSPCSYCKNQKSGYVTMLLKTYQGLPITFRIEFNFPFLNTRLLMMSCPSHLLPHPGTGFHFNHSKHWSLLFSYPHQVVSLFSKFANFVPSFWNTIFPSLCLTNFLSSFGKLKHHLFQEAFPESPSQLQNTSHPFVLKANSLLKQNQNCLYVSKIAPLEQNTFMFLSMRKQQGRLDSYYKYILYKISGILKCVLVWICKKGPHPPGVGKQANETCSKKLEYRTSICPQGVYVTAETKWGSFQRMSKLLRAQNSGQANEMEENVIYIQGLDNSNNSWGGISGKIMRPNWAERDYTHGNQPHRCISSPRKMSSGIAVETKGVEGWY